MDSNPNLPTNAATLPSGAAMPLLGFGTWQLKGSEATQATAWALEAGYRHLDTATIYENEGEVGAALASSGVPRGEVFVTTKLPPELDEAPLATLNRSLELLKTDHVNLWLIHWPPEAEGAGVGIDRWEALVEAQRQGLATDIGVSNYPVELIDQLKAATGVTPAVNQVEWSPLLANAAELAGNRERGIVLEGYSALRGGTLENPVIGAIAARLGRTPAQVIIRWHLEHGIVVIPKSREQHRIVSNADVGGFTLSGEDVAAIDALDESV